MSEADEIAGNMLAASGGAIPDDVPGNTRISQVAYWVFRDMADQGYAVRSAVEAALLRQLARKP